ncbi:putative Late nodulin [Medicago truncatula]|uniref:Putative Late nodulin n=1 Tax=Medicago truncatula TaxID=3880 RepID=A0A396I6D0_MEDTR|nr:putative Late nodulin [Medicago truncatula]
MVEIVKFVYIINIFIFLFLVATNVEAKFTRCFRDSDCPKTLCHSPGKAKCMHHSICKCIFFGYNI